jgi:hypothetical protein
VTDIEILTCATLIGTLDDKPDIALKLGMLVFGEKNDALASDLAAKYSSQCRDNIAGGCKNFFYNVYRPDSAKALERWLDWFGPLTAVGQEYTDHITKVADAVLKNALTQTHTEVGSCVSVILKHGIHRQIQNFAVMETCMDTIRAVEGKSVLCWWTNLKEDTFSSSNIHSKSGTMICMRTFLYLCSNQYAPVPGILG